MKHFIAVILIFIMLMFETKMELFKNKKCKTNINSTNNLKTLIINDTQKKIKTNNQCLCEGFLTKINLWIYNPSELSSEKWINFYSRKNFRDSSSIIDLSIDSVIKYSNNYFNIRVFDQSAINRLIPEFKKDLGNCKNSYSFINLLKYAILYKYGGLWIPKDTIMLNTFHIDTNSYYSGKILTFKTNNLNYTDNKGISDDIIAANRLNPFIKNMLKFIVNSNYRFQNSYKFKNTVNKHFNNQILKNDIIRHYPIVLEKNMKDTYLDAAIAMSTFNNDIINYKDKVFYHIRLDILKQLPMHSYITRMSRKQILDSNLFIRKLIDFSNKKEKNLVHNGNISGLNI